MRRFYRTQEDKANDHVLAAYVLPFSDMTLDEAQRGYDRIEAPDALTTDTIENVTRIRRREVLWDIEAFFKGIDNHRRAS